MNKKIVFTALVILLASASSSPAYSGLAGIIKALKSASGGPLAGIAIAIEAGPLKAPPKRVAVGLMKPPP